MSDEPHDRKGDAEPPKPTLEAEALQKQLLEIVRESGLTPREIDEGLGLPLGSTKRLLAGVGELEQGHVDELAKVLDVELGVRVAGPAVPARLTAQDVVSTLERHQPSHIHQQPTAPRELDIDGLSSLVIDAVDRALRRLRR